METNSSLLQAVQNPANSQSEQSPITAQTVKPKGNKTILAAIFIIGGLCVLLLLMLVILTGKPHLLLKKGSSPTPNGLVNGLPAYAPTINPVSSGTPDPKDFTFKIDKVIPNPPVKGGSPDSGKQFLEIDLTATYAGTEAEYIPGIFYYLNSSGTLFIASADLQHADKPNQHLIIPNKKSLYSVKFIQGMTAQGVYLIFQIPSGDHGKLIWLNPQNPDKNNQRVTFTLF